LKQANLRTKSENLKNIILTEAKFEVKKGDLTQFEESSSNYEKLDLNLWQNIPQNGKMANKSRCS